DEEVERWHAGDDELRIVLARGDRLALPGVGTEGGFEGGGCPRRDRVVIEDRLKARLDLEIRLRRRVRHRSDTVRRAAHTVEQLSANALIEGADCAPQERGVRNDIPGAAGLKRADRHDAERERILLAADHALHVDDET